MAGMNVKLQPLEREANGKIEFFSIIEDISDKKLAEENMKDSENRLSSLIMNLKEAILLEDQNRRIVLTNTNFCSMFNIPVAPEVLTGADCSTSAEDSKHLFKNPDKFVQRIDQILKNKKMVMSEELEMAMNKAEESSKAKESFLAHMSHEIRTPLNVITGLIREVSKEPLSDRQQNFIKKAGMAGKHLLSIVNDILDISKIEAGLLLLEHRIFDLHEVIKDTIELEQPIANEKMLRLIADISSETGKAYIGDPVRVRQILMNLISNAIKTK